MAINKIIFWASDYSQKSGEGRLARLFISKLKKQNRINKLKIIISLFTKQDRDINKKKFSSWRHKYVGPIYGIVKLWIFFLRGWRPCYLNYLPLWNFFIFLSLPPNTILGPITGSILKDKKFFLKNLLEQISIFIIKIRYKNKIFSNNFYQNMFKQSCHNFILSDLVISKLNKRKRYDFIFYIRGEFYNKNFFFQNLINQLLQLNFKIATIGDKINLHGVKNFGYCDNKKVNTIISLSKCAIGNKENLYSFFIQDCLKQNLTVFYNIEFKKYELFKFNNFYPIVYNNHKTALKEILKKMKIKKKSNLFKKINFNNYFKNVI
tara:strand:+ start:7198 stop:8160 length:963 start_codon:yes stop_codon:yes gene_type:complete